MKKITYETVLNYDTNLIRGFMRGIIAGEGCIQDSPRTGHYTVHISATNPEEREIYKKCLAQLEIHLKIYQNYKETYISEKQNILGVARQNLMTLSKEKNEKFIFMMQHYTAKRSVGRVKQEHINKILKLYREGAKISEIQESVSLANCTIHKIIKRYKNN